MLDFTPPTRARGARIYAGTSLVGALLTLLCCGTIEPQDLECEEAVAHLDACCAGFDNTKLQCDHYTTIGGCLSSSHEYFPALGEDESRCIRSTTCVELVAHRVCERAQAARTNDASEASRSFASRVCP